MNFKDILKQINDRFRINTYLTPTERQELFSRVMMSRQSQVVESGIPSVYDQFDHASPSYRVKSPFRIALIRVLAFSVIFILTGGMAFVAAAEYALPGEGLYSIKTQFNEELRGELKRDPEEKLAYKVELVETRLAEAKIVISQKKKLDEKTQEIIAGKIYEHINDVNEQTNSFALEDPERYLATAQHVKEILERGLNELEHLIDETNEDIISEEINRNPEGGVLLANIVTIDEGDDNSILKVTEHLVERSEKIKGVIEKSLEEVEKLPTDPEDLLPRSIVEKDRLRKHMDYFEKRITTIEQAIKTEAVFQVVEDFQKDLDNNEKILQEQAASTATAPDSIEMVTEDLSTEGGSDEEGDDTTITTQMESTDQKTGQNQEEDDISPDTPPVPENESPEPEITLDPRPRKKASTSIEEIIKGDPVKDLWFLLDITESAFRKQNYKSTIKLFVDLETALASLEEQYGITPPPLVY